jgi:DNA-binding beta-propeller fold protein YncE
MLALIYLALAIYLGDLLCRRFYRFISLPHRWAAAILVGILLSTWFTYLAGLVFAHTANALLWADLLFFVIAPGAIFWLSRKASKVDMIAPRAPGSSRWDWITLGVLFAAVCILLMGTLYVNKQGRIRLYGMEASDFTPQLAIAQSFALGHAGQPNHHDFLFYFQAGNLELLGLNLAWSVDVLSVLGLISMLALVMVLGELLFNSRVVGRMGAALFFFPGSPAFIQILKSQSAFQEAVRATPHLFVNQRHLPFAIGIFLLVLIFLVDQYCQRTLVTSAWDALMPAPSFIFPGLLLGALLLWDARVFIAAAAVLSFLFVLFPCRWQMVQLGLTAAAVGLPQLLYLRSGQIAPRQYSLFHWGYIVENPTIIRVIDYIAFTFGLKWPVIILALLLVSWFQRRFFIAMCSLFVLAFCMQLGPEALTSHKFLNIWIVMANLFAAYGLWWLWKLKTALILGPVIATALTASIVAGGVIDLSPIYNRSRIEVNYEREPLVKGLGFRTSVIYKVPDSLAAGVAGKDLSKTPVTAFEGGQGNGKGQFDGPRGIAIDTAGNIFIADTNNGRIEEFSPSGVFITSMGTKGKDHGQFGGPSGLAVDHCGYIYVAEALNHRVQKLAPNGTFIAEWAPGFYGPGRIAIGPDDSIYVVDSGRTRIVKFSPDGRVLTEWGSGGHGDGQFADHTSVAVDPTTDKVYVADPVNNRIQIFDPDGKFLTKWLVPEWGRPLGFEDLAIDLQRGRLYASSVHMNTILVFDLQGNRTGTLTPSPPDKLNGPSALALAKDKLLVLNRDSARVSVIDLQNN